jgi:hypothetical protein
MEKDRVLHLLENADWKDIILKLTHYALQRARVYSWKSGKSDQLLGGKTPEDIAFEAIEKVLSGTRDWDPDKYPNLLTHLQWVVKSDMEHLASSMEHQATGRMPEPGEGEEGYETIPGPSSPTPEEELIAREKEDLEERLKGELYAMVKGDEDLETLLLCFEEGIDKPEIIAAQTGWDVSKVYNLKRKLLRKASKLRVNPQ